MHQRQRDQRRTGERRCRMQRTEPPRIVRQHGTGPIQRRRGLRDMNDSGAKPKISSQSLAYPGQKRIPMRRLAGAQRRWTLGAVEHEIRRQIFPDFRCDLVLRRADAVDDGIGKPRQRHLGRLDIFALRGPFIGERASEFCRWRGECAAARRVNGFAVEVNRVVSLGRLGCLVPSVASAALACGNCHRLIETTPQRRPHRAPRGLDRTVRLMTF
jgi:hypothetical protein